MLSALTAQYYLPRAILPHEILLPLETEDCAELSEVLTKRAGHKVWVHVPQRGEKAELLSMAERNRPGGGGAGHHCRGADCLHPGAAGEDALPARAAEADGVLRHLQHGKERHRGLHGGLQRHPAPEERYRRFRIQGLEGHPDDYASMQEVLRRRLRRAADGDEKFLPLPDVFLIDGGETHARAALAVAREFGVEVPIFGMVKDDRHRTRALVTPEGRGDRHRHPAGGVLPHRPDPEETHRFAITYHHESHSKKRHPAPPWTASPAWERSGGRTCGNTSAPSKPSGRRMWTPLPPWCPGPPPRRCGSTSIGQRAKQIEDRNGDPPGSRWLRAGRLSAVDFAEDPGDSSRQDHCCQHPCVTYDQINQAESGGLWYCNSR